MRNSFAEIIILFSLITLRVSAQGIVSGKVYDNTTHESLPGVYVMFGKGLGTSTGKDGSYRIESDTGRLTISFQLLGYKQVTKQVYLRTGETTELNTGLEIETLEINQVVVSADRNERRISDLTVSIDVIKEDFISGSHITDPQELINKTPGIEVLDGQISIRGGSGFSYGVGSRVLALIDGLPFMSADAGNIKWSFLPLENLSQVEIIKGASSVMYGSSALNGIINFRSADASNVPVTECFIETGIFDYPKNKKWKWWNTPRIFSSAAFSHLQKIGKTDIGLGINLLYDDGYRKSNYEKQGRINLRFKHRNARVEGLTYGINLTAGNTNRIDFLLWEDADSGALKQDTSSISKLRGTYLSVDPYISLNRGGRFRHDFRMRFQSSENKFPVRVQNNASSISLYSEYQMWYKIFDFMNLTSGASQTYSKIGSNFFGDHVSSNAAIFSQLEVKPFERLKFQAGIRAEQNSLDNIHDRIVPVFRTGINFRAAEYTFLRASFGEGYRYPSIAEKYASTTLGSIKIFPNQYIEPETGWSSELGIKQGIMFERITGQADLSFFFSQNSNMIEYLFALWENQNTGTFDMGFRAVNIEQSRVYGAEIEFLLNRSTGDINTTIGGGYTFIYPVEFNSYTKKNEDIYLKYRRKHSGKISINSSWKKFETGLNIYARSKILNIDDVFLNISSREKILPGFYDYWANHNTGYFMMDYNIGYRLNKILNISLVAKNITNTEYMGRPGDIQPHRNYSLRVAGRF
jgi:outer membrane cobalamin receptor